MSEREGFETIKMIERGENCHIVMDYVRGDPLIYWLRYHIHISKEQLFLWMEQLVLQMEQYHRCTGSPCYRYLNPYSIIVTEKDNLALLDLEAESNSEILRNMQKRSIRQNFSPQGITRQNKKRIDIYGIGKTIQFLLAQTEPEPKLSKREEHLLTSIISRCIDSKKKHSYGDIQSILHDLPKIKKSKKIAGHEKSFVLWAHLWKITLVLILSGIVGSIFSIKPWKQESKKEVQTTTYMKTASAKESKVTEKEADIYLEMGLVQFVELQEYEKSKEYFSKISSQSKIAKRYIEMADYMLGNSNKLDENQIEHCLETVENIVKSSDDKNWISHYVALIRVYATRDGRSDSEKILKLGKQLNFSVQWNDLEEELAMEIKNDMAASYEALDQNIEAIKTYEELRTSWKNEKKLEGVYTSLIMLYKKMGQGKDAVQCAKQAMEQYTESMDFKIEYIAQMCGEQSIERAECAKEIQRCIDLNPELEKQDRYLTLQREYSITKDKGGIICVGK